MWSFLHSWYFDWVQGFTVKFCYCLSLIGPTICRKMVGKTVYLEISYAVKDILGASLRFVAKEVVKPGTDLFFENAKKMFVEEYIFTWETY